MMSQLSRSTRLTKLSPSLMFKLRSFLDPQDKWMELAAVIVNSHGEEKYSMADMDNFKLQLQKGGSPTQALLRDWSYDNVSVQCFLKALADCERYDVLSWMLVDKMKEMSMDEFEEQADKGWDGYFEVKKEPNAKPTENSSPDLDVVESKQLADTATCMDFAKSFGSGLPSGADLDCPPKEVETMAAAAATEQLCVREQRLEYYTYSTLMDLTDEWNIDPVSSGGRLLGSGGYADVFLGKPKDRREIAVKRLKLRDTVEKQFLQEVEVLSSFGHPNIVPLFGVSKDGPHWCIVYEFMENGTLEDRLECKDGTPPLSGPQRSRIAKGVAQGLNYLHTKDEIAYIHRDIKSANILLDYDFSAKIGDLGLAHTGPAVGKSYTITKAVIGTQVYCAPEYMHGEISEKLDAYSMGVVLYEMVTGLPAYDESRSSVALSSYVRSHSSGKKTDSSVIVQLVDSRVQGWSKEAVQQVFDMAFRLTAPDKYDRPRVRDVLPEIMDWP